MVARAKQDARWRVTCCAGEKMDGQGSAVKANGEKSCSTAKRIQAGARRLKRLAGYPRQCVLGTSRRQKGSNTSAGRVWLVRVYKRGLLTYAAYSGNDGHASSR